MPSNSKEYMREYRKREVYKKHQSSKEVKERHIEKYRQARELYPEKDNARAAVRYAVSSGKLLKKNCEICGSEDSEGHHDDYSKPLEVRWLCRIHHSEHHRKLLTARISSPASTF